MMRQLFYDLTELLYLSRGFKSYYGIAKVVAEGAKEAFRQDCGTRFVAYSQAHDRMFEIFPKYDPRSEGGIDLNVPSAGVPTFTRRVFPRDKSFLQSLGKYILPVFDIYQRRLWDKENPETPWLSLDGGAWLSCARPKLMISAIAHLDAQDVEIHALLYDIIPLHDEKKTTAGTFGNSFHADTNYVIENADHIISISKYTADDITTFSDKGQLAKPRRMSVAPLVHELRKGDDLSVIDMPERPYFLMVGTSLGRKNLDVVLEAMLLITHKVETPPLLVLAGRRRKRTMKYLDKPRMASVRPHVLQIDSPNQTDLYNLYQAAQGVILASEIEGWGLPAAEALWAGVPALCSDIPVMHEVCGSMGLYFQLNDSETLANHMTRLTDGSGFRAEHVASIENSKEKLRSWRDFGQDLLRNVQTFSSP